MGVVEDAIANALYTIASNAIRPGWNVTEPDNHDTDIWIILRHRSKLNPSKPIMIVINYYKPEGIVYVSYEVWHKIIDLGQDVGGYTAMFDIEVPIADPKSLQKIESTLKDYVDRGNMNVGA